MTPISFFKDLEDKDLVKQVNNIISPGRTKISKSNYYSSMELIEDYIDLLGIEDLNESIKRYMEEKQSGRSVENFIKHMERYKRGE